MSTDKKTAEHLRKEYPNHVPLSVAAPYLGVSARQLSWLVAEGRQPFASIGGNIGTKQRYVLSLIYDAEAFGCATGQGCFAAEMSGGENGGTAVTLTIQEPLPSMKRLTESIEEHWKAMLHAAIGEAARQGPIPHFEKAFVEIEIVTTMGSDNARLWDTSNRAINVVINNLKGIFFEDDNMKHRWGDGRSTRASYFPIVHCPSFAFYETIEVVSQLK